jgi:hypothetical protein
MLIAALPDTFFVLEVEHLGTVCIRSCHIDHGRMYRRSLGGRWLERGWREWLTRRRNRRGLARTSGRK